MSGQAAMADSNRDATAAPADHMIGRHTLTERVFRGEVTSGGRGLVGLWYTVRDDVERLVRCRFVIYQMVRSALRVRYQNSFLGLLWTLLHPLMMLTVLSLVFSQVLRIGSVENYPVFLLPGLVTWQFLTACINSSTSSLTQRQGLIRKVNVFLLLFPASDVCIAAVHTAIALVAMFAIALFALIPASVCLIAFAAGVSLLVMTLATFFRDVEHFVTVVLQAAYFASPVMYPPETLPEEVRWIMDVNPARWLIDLFRDPISYGQWPGMTAWIVGASAATISLVVGYTAYKRCEHAFIFRL
jgi:ABC-2 type transport system permease protein/lipopolysaccharide transport system permease protein